MKNPQRVMVCAWRLLMVQWAKRSSEHNTLELSLLLMNIYHQILTLSLAQPATYHGTVLVGWRMRCGWLPDPTCIRVYPVVMVTNLRWHAAVIKTHSPAEMEVFESTSAYRRSPVAMATKGKGLALATSRMKSHIRSGRECPMTR